MAVRLGMLGGLRQPACDGGAVRVGGRVMDGCELWYPCVTAAAYNVPVTRAGWEAGSVTPLRAVTMDGEELAVASNDPALTVYGLDLDYTAGSQAITLVYAGHAVDVVMTVS